MLHLQVFANEKNAVIAGLPSMEESKDNQFFAAETSGIGAQNVLDSLQENLGMFCKFNLAHDHIGLWSSMMKNMCHLPWRVCL